MKPTSSFRTGLVAIGFLAASFAGANAQSQDPSAQKFPDVGAVKVQQRGGAVFDFDVTVSSP